MEAPAHRIGVDAELGGVRAHVVEGDLRRLLHHVTELAGERQARLAVGRHRKRRGLDEQHVATVPGDRQPGGHARQLGAVGHVVDDLGPSEPLREVVGVERRQRLASGDSRGGLARQAAELALERADAGLPRVAADDTEDGGVVDGQFAVGEAGALALARQQVAVGDEHLLVVGVAVEADDVHAVEQRSRHGVEHVGGGDEHDLREVEVELEVVVAERVVLRRVEHLQQRGGRVAGPRAGRELVDLVEQHDRVHRAGLGDRLDDAPGLRPDVRAAVAADLRLVADPAEGHADELAAHRPSDRLAERGLADARRPDEGDDRASATPGGDPLGVLVDAALVTQLAHGEELDDARLDIGEAVVVLVEDALRRGEVEAVVAAHTPRQFEDAVEPRADPRVLRRLRAGALEAVDLLGDERARRVGGVEVADLGAVLADDVVVALAELLADGGELLAEQELALLLVDPLGHVVADGLGNLQLGEVVARPRQDQPDAVGDIDGGEHVAAALLGEVGPRHDAVGQRAGLEAGAQQLGKAPRTAQLGDLLERGAQLACQRLDAWCRARIAQQLGVGIGGATLGGVDGGDPCPRLDADDGDRFARRQGADVGDLGDDGELIVAGAQQHPTVARTTSRLDGAAQLVGDEGEGDDGAG